MLWRSSNSQVNTLLFSGTQNYSQHVRTHAGFYLGIFVWGGSYKPTSQYNHNHKSAQGEARSFGGSLKFFRGSSPLPLTWHVRKIWKIIFQNIPWCITDSQQNTRLFQVHVYKHLSINEGQSFPHLLLWSPESNSVPLTNDWRDFHKHTYKEVEEHIKTHKEH